MSSSRSDNEAVSLNTIFCEVSFRVLEFSLFLFTIFAHSFIKALFNRMKDGGFNSL